MTGDENLGAVLWIERQQNRPSRDHRFDQVKSPVRGDRAVSRRPRRETSPAYHVAAITRETHSLCYVGALIAASEIESGTDCIQTTIVEIMGSRGEINGASRPDGILFCGTFSNR